MSHRQVRPVHRALFTLFTSIVITLTTLTGDLSATGKRTYGDAEAIVVEVHDGDTLKVNVPSWPPVIGEGIGVRVYGIDCRELKDGATVARDTAKKWIPEGSKVMLIGLRRDKYFRLLSSVGFDCEKDEDGELECKDLAEEMLAHKLAVPYYGEKKQAFPKEIK